MLVMSGKATFYYNNNQVSQQDQVDIGLDLTPMPNMSMIGQTEIPRSHLDSSSATSLFRRHTVNYPFRLEIFEVEP